MQEYGALLRNTFKNPFDDFNASLIDTDKIVRFWCDPIDKGQKELLSAPVFFTQKMPFIIQGSRGSGKTMLFKYYSYFYSVAQKRLDLVFKDVSIDVKQLFGGTEDLLEECKNNAGSRKEHIRQILKMDSALSADQSNAIIGIIEVPDNPIMEMLNALWVIRNPDKDKLKL